MSSTQPPHEGRAPDSPSDVRALPARPSLEFERKQAKKLLAALHDSDPAASARVRAKMKGSAHRKPAEFQLSDAQFTIAREYGFTSWPRLVEYFETLARHEASGGHAQAHGREANEMWARGIIAKQRNCRNEAAQILAAFVPRFYGRSNEEVFAAEVTIEDAYLVQARLNRYPSWEVMLAEDRLPDNEWERHKSPMSKALRAIRAEDAGQFADILEAHPELLTETLPGQPGNISLVHSALIHDLRMQSPGAWRILDWLRERIDLRSTLNWALLGHWNMPTGSAQQLLDAGADPSWTAPNGYTVIEHAIVRYWNQEAVDLIASRVTAPKSFWVAAGLGDVQAVERYVDRKGIPTESARKNRPDFTALHMGFLPLNPAADDRTIVWEAFLVAALNQRFEVLDVLLDRGFPIDYGAWGQPIIHLAVGNGWVPLLEYLVRRGANVELARDGRAGVPESARSCPGETHPGALRRTRSGSPRSRTRRKARASRDADAPLRRGGVRVREAGRDSPGTQRRRS